jgi:hypothetical protein
VALLKVFFAFGAQAQACAVSQIDDASFPRGSRTLKTSSLHRHVRSVLLRNRAPARSHTHKRPFPFTSPGSAG